MSTDPAVVQPTTEQLVAAFAQGLLPLLGPAGIAASALVPAAEQLADMFRNHGTVNYTIDDLVATVEEGNAALLKLRADINAQQGGGS